MLHKEFFNILKKELANSLASQRKVWGTIIVNENYSINELSILLNEDKKTALRFTWLLSEIGIIDPNKLLNILPELLQQSEKINHFDFKHAFATFWLISGVPIENEAIAISLLFEWIGSKHINKTTKSRAIKVINQLAVKYPDLLNELTIHTT